MRQNDTIEKDEVSFEIELKIEGSDNYRTLRGIVAILSCLSLVDKIDGFERWENHIKSMELDACEVENEDGSWSDYNPTKSEMKQIENYAEMKWMKQC